MTNNPYRVLPVQSNRAVENTGGTVTVAPNAKITFYKAGTLDLSSVYSNVELTDLHPNPLSADADGVVPPVFTNGSVALKILATDADGVTLDGYPVDYVVGTPLLGLTASIVTFQPSSGITSTNVQDALEEVDEKAEGFEPRIVTLESDKAPINSPQFTGVPTSPNPSSGDSSTKIATTSFVASALADRPVFQAWEEQTSGTNGGSSTATTNHTRVLNQFNTDIPGATLASNTITLPAGKYTIVASAPAFRSAQHQLRLETDAGALVALGTSEYSDSSSWSVSRSHIFDTFTLSSETDLVLKHYFTKAKATDGLGVAASTGQDEIFTTLSIWRVNSGSNTDLPNVFDSIASVEAITVDASINEINTRGYYTVGDKGAGRYQRVGSLPNHDAWVQDNGGAYFELVPGVLGINPYQVGAKGVDQVSGDDAAFNAMISWVNDKGSTADFTASPVMMHIPEGLFPILTDLDPILVSFGRVWGPGRIEKKNVKLFVIGDASNLVTEWSFEGFAVGIPVSATTAIPTPVVVGSGARVVEIVNGAGIDISIRARNIGHLVYSVPASGKNCSRITIRNMKGCSFNGAVSPVYIVNTLGGNGSALWIHDCSLYRYPGSSAPNRLPVAVTGASAANPMVINSVGHPILSGDKVTMKNLGGLTSSVNGQTFTATYIDADNFSIPVDGTDTGTNGTYSSGGHFSENHWSSGSGAKFCYIEGQWDTIRVHDTVFQHFEYGFHLKTSLNGVISFIDFDNVLHDINSNALIWLDANNASFGGHMRIQGGECDVCDGALVKLTRAGSEVVQGFKIDGVEVVCLGLGLIEGTLAMLVSPVILDNEIYGAARNQTSPAIMIDVDSVSDGVSIRGNIMAKPLSRFGGIANDVLLPDTAVRVADTSIALDIRGNKLRCANSGAGFDVALGTSEGKNKVMRGNVVDRWDGASWNDRLAENYQATTPSLTGTSHVFTNNEPFPVCLALRGGTLTSAIISVANDGGATTVAESSDVIIPVGSGQSVTLSYPISHGITAKVYPFML